MRVWWREDENFKQLSIESNLDAILETVSNLLFNLDSIYMNKSVGIVYLFCIS